MKNKNIILSALLIGSIASGGCGGGGSGNGGSSGAPQSSPLLSKGVITGFGSVFVNGVEYETTGSSVSMDGSSASESDLRLGMVVTVNGTSNGITGSATSIDFKDNLEGVVCGIDPANNTMNVMGQTVMVDALTHYDDITGLSALSAGNIVEVSGLPDSSGIIRATYVEFVSPSLVAGTEMEIKGTVSNLNTTDKTFKIGGLTVDYGGAALDDLPSGLSDGLFVEVKSQSAVDCQTATLVASAVESASSDITGQAGTQAEIEGFVTELNGDTLKVDGQQIRVTSSTVYENGTAANIALNVKLEVHGTLDASGTLIADKVSFKN